MSPPRHRIRRQILEIQVPDASSAWPLQTLLSTLQVQQIEPLLDACLSQLCPSDTLLRIDRLEIDLGVLSLPQLAEQLPAKLAAALPQALQAQQRRDMSQSADPFDGQGDGHGHGHGHGEPPESASRMELLAYFAQTGALPWWADARKPQPLRAALDGLLSAPPSSLPRQLRDLLADRTRRLRLIQHLPDDSLLHLCAALAAPTTPYPKNRESTAVLHALLDVARRAGLTQLAVPATRLRQSLFLATLGRLASSASPPAPLAGPAFVQDLLPYVALEAGLSHAVLASGLSRELPPAGGNASLEVLRQALRDTLASPAYAAIDSQAKLANPSYRQSPAQSADLSAARHSPDRALTPPPARPSPVTPLPPRLPAASAQSPSDNSEGFPLSSPHDSDRKPSESHALARDARGPTMPPADRLMPPSTRELVQEQISQFDRYSVHQSSLAIESQLPTAPRPDPDPDRKRLATEDPPAPAASPPAQSVGDSTLAESDAAMGPVLAQLCDQLVALYDRVPAEQQSSIQAVLRLVMGIAEVDGRASAQTATLHEATAATTAPEPDATTATSNTAAAVPTTAPTVSIEMTATPETVATPDLTSAGRSPDATPDATTDATPDATPDATTKHQVEPNAAERVDRNADEGEAARVHPPKTEAAMPAPANPVAAAGWPTARLRQLLQLLLHMRPLRLVPVATLGSALAAVGEELARRAAAQSVAAGALAMSRPLRRWPAAAQPTPPAVDLAFSRGEEVYVQNAGLVLLWPFLSSLFHALGLCFRGQFADPMARHRATGLLHYLATGEREPVEYQLTLAKLLCGLDDEDLLEFGEPVSDAEAEECDRALQAAIAHAQLLGEMSPSDFRTLFLLNPGVLSPRAESLLLRVERTPHTALVERFPWPCSWIRLPWLRIPLQVEW